MSDEATGVDRPTAQAEPSAGASSPARRRRWLRWLLVVAVLLAIDFAQPPSRQVSARLLAGSIGLYQASVSRVLPRLGVQCRFEPTCSHYGKASIEKYGALEGSYRTARRLLRCNPWTPLGTVDPP